jgi:LuxR family transcriptional regulator, maltose regulon positive regulatory protein
VRGDDRVACAGLTAAHHRAGAESAVAIGVAAYDRIVSRPVLIAAKLRPPVLRDQLVTRSRLLGRLRAGSGRRLTIVACPAGFGKTTLLAEWREIESVRQPVAWLSLDERDNDPVVFWTYVIEALKGACPAVREAKLPRPTQAVSGSDTVLPLLVNELCRLNAVTLILDDCHRLTSAAVRASLAWFVRNAPRNFRLVLSTRTEPPLPLGAMRAHGEVLELDAEDLRFTPSEAGVFLNARLAPGLRPADVAGLVERTEGWPAGLSLAAFSLQRTTDRDTLIRGLGPASRHLADFLLTEVLQAHDGSAQSLLMRCSILDRLHGPLCDAVLEQADSRETLESLVRTNLFVAPIPGEHGWYRVGPVFAQLLRAELERREPGLARALHRRAYAWHRDYGTAEEAVRHALAAGAYAEAADLIAACWSRFAREGKFSLVLAWLRQLPGEALAGDVRLLLVEAWTFALSGKRRRAEQAVAAIERLGELSDGPLADGFSSADASLTLLRACFSRGDVAGQLRNARRAAELEGTLSPWRPVACWAVGIASYRRGELSEADRWFAESLTLPAGTTLPVGASSLAYRSLIAGEHRDLDRQRVLAEQAMHVVRGLGVGKANGIVPLALGVSLAARGRPAEAHLQIERGIARLRRSKGQPTDIAMALMHQASVLSALGDGNGSQGAADQARAILESCPDGRLLAQRLQTLDPTLGTRHKCGNGELTEQELRVLKLLAGDLSERGIGNELYVSYNTVHSHVRSIYRKLGISSRSQALKRAKELALFQRPELRADSA